MSGVFFIKSGSFEAFNPRFRRGHCVRFVFKPCSHETARFVDNLVVVIGILIECRREMMFLLDSSLILLRSPKANNFVRFVLNLTEFKSEKKTLQKVSQTIWLNGSSGCVIPKEVRFASIRFGWSSYQGRMGDVLALGGFEGRGRLRKAWGNRQTGDDPGIPELAVTEYIGCSGQRGELKHLSIRRNRKKNRFPE